ncbi:MAG: hypothetical protein J6V72_02020 [Kiritimatiellae bacterium]|nr:hypothetical protein [Kiritimatiellia bacterium]
MEERDDFVTVSISGPLAAVTYLMERCILGDSEEDDSDDLDDTRETGRFQYVYTDEDGVELYRVTRRNYIDCVGKPRKSFRVEIKKGDGSWGHGRIDRHVPYILKGLRHAALIGGKVAICNGERATDAFLMRHGYEREGIAATTFIGGLRHWRDEYAQYFNGVGEVIVVADPERAKKFAEVFEPAVKGLVGKVSYRTEEEMGVA